MGAWVIGFLVFLWSCCGIGLVAKLEHDMKSGETITVFTYLIAGPFIWFVYFEEVTSFREWFIKNKEID